MYMIVFYRTVLDSECVQLNIHACKPAVLWPRHDQANKLFGELFRLEKERELPSRPSQVISQMCKARRTKTLLHQRIVEMLPFCQVRESLMAALGFRLLNGFSWGNLSWITNCKCWHRVQVHLDQWVLFLPPLGTRHFHHSSHILRHSPYEHFWYVW